MAQSVTKEAKVIARHSMVYGLSNVLDRAVGFVMLPVYTRFLTPADYGIMELIYMTTSIISLVIGFGLEAAVSRFYFDYEDDASRKKVVSTAIVGYGAVTVTITAILLPFSGIFSKLVLESAQYSNLFIVALLTLATGMILPINYAYLRVQQRSFEYMITKVGMTAVNLGMNIYFVVFAKMGVYGILLSNLLAQLLFVVILNIRTLLETKLRIDYGVLKEMLKFGLPLIPSNISAYIVQASDRYFVNHYDNTTMTGLYSLGYKFGTLINQFVTSPFIQIWGPRRMEYFGKEGYEKIFARIFTYFCTASLFAGLLISLLSREVIMLMADKSFWSAYKVVPIVTLAYIVFSFHYHFSVGILMKKATKYMAYVNIANGILNLALNFLLIPPFNVWGAALATLICFIFKATMIFYFSNRFYKIEMEWRRLFMLFGIAFALFFAGYHIDSGSIWLNVLAKTGIGFCFPVLLYIFRFFDNEEIKRLKYIIKYRKFEYE
ncbi:putative Polysaccharide biosynthesis protein [Candidatus Zixiibacteriota bacterium]|nr:putative Polysaccharide biosynthesis protein [candidate division Zixibacteria bacterium]